MSKHPPTPIVDTELPEEYSAEWLYDAMMSQIEPDLTLENIGRLEEKYAGETPEHKKWRDEKYENAFLLYDDCLSELDWVLTEDAKTLKDQVMRLAKILENDDQEIAMNTANSDLDSSVSAQ